MFRGQVINFEQNITNLVQQLPHALSSMSETILIRRESDDVSQFVEFRVRRQIVREALIWLLENNSLFSNRISLNLENLNHLPENASIAEHFTQILTNEAQENNDDEESNVQSTGAFDVPVPNVRQNINDVLNADRLNPNDNNLNQIREDVLDFNPLNPQPLNEFTHGILALAYPCIYPYGIIR